MNQETIYLLAIIKYLLNGKKEATPIPYKDMDWRELFQLAKRHNVLNLVYYGIEGLQDEYKPKEEIVQIFYKSAMQAIVVSYNQIEAAKELLDAFEKAGVDVLAVKGICTKMHYSQPDMRTMGDIDLLFKSPQQAMLKKVMRELRYDQSEEGRKHDSYFRQPYINMEMHRELVSADSEYYLYYKNIWNRIRVKEGCNHIYEMSREDEYIYTIIHLVEHFKNGGIGIRFIMDVYVYNQMQCIDWKYVETELKGLELLEFYKYISCLAEKWFGHDNAGYKENIVEEMERFVVSCGVFGTAENAAAVSVEKDGRTKFLLRTIFPNLDNMKTMFPWLEKWPIFLPYSWVLRGIRSVLYRRKNIKMQFEKAKNGNKEHGENLKDFYQKCGL